MEDEEFGEETWKRNEKTQEGKVDEEQQKELGSKNVKLTSFIIQLTSSRGRRAGVGRAAVRAKNETR